MHLTWSRGGKDKGWVYYDPHWERVSYVEIAGGKSLTDAMIATDLGPEPLEK
jgi:hypothetical protein